MKIFEGKVVSTGMMNTVVVEIFRTTPHPLYKKLVRRSKKYNVDSNGFAELSVGSVVKITETKPISKNKYFKILEIVGSAKQTKKSEKIDIKDTAEAVKTEKVEASVSIEKPKAKKTTKAVSAKSKKTKKESN